MKNRIRSRLHPIGIESWIALTCKRARARPLVSIACIAARWQEGRTTSSEREMGREGKGTVERKTQDDDESGWNSLWTLTYGIEDRVNVYLLPASAVRNRSDRDRYEIWRIGHVYRYTRLCNCTSSSIPSCTPHWMKTVTPITPCETLQPN